MARDTLTQQTLVQLIDAGVVRQVTAWALPQGWGDPLLSLRLRLWSQTATISSTGSLSPSLTW
ncbi:hypothetical protein [Zobellella maritima]|uniref:hypothetical protein n=1 Tax=Zobellella maritima TaxID=2059725 RepID=UPI000E30B2F8|nr:hypothetical protein [Zobellella maritima]